MMQRILDPEAFALWCALPVTEGSPYVWPIDRTTIGAQSECVESEVY